MSVRLAICENRRISRKIVTPHPALSNILLQYYQHGCRANLRERSTT